MARIAGVTTQKNEKGDITHITIYLKKHKEVIPVLTNMGIMEKSRLQQELESDEWLTVDEARALSLKHIEEAWKKL